LRGILCSKLELRHTPHYFAVRVGFSCVKAKIFGMGGSEIEMQDDGVFGELEIIGS
jgi:hypothetical protein